MILRLMVVAIAAAAVVSYGADAPVNGSVTTTVTVGVTKDIQDKDHVLGVDTSDHNPYVKADKIARQFKVPLDSVNALHASYKIGWGGIAKAIALSQRVEGYSARDILSMKIDQKMGWGQIAKKLELKPGESYKPGDKTTGATNVDKMEMKTEKQEQKMDKKQDKMEAKEIKMDDKKK
ncbi:MAG: hypothetical protein PHC61_05990 [Chitinivibrionales bacterium]|nr:hypothetical protein [Chitinivibrionales bacterium]